MPYGFAAQVAVNVVAHPQQAAQQTQTAFEKAIAAAFRSQAVQSALASAVKASTKGAGQIGQAYAQQFQKIQQQGQKAAQNLTHAFQQVHQAAQKALATQPSRGLSPELSTLQQHLIAVTGNMQQLATASRQTFLVMEEVGRSARAAARSADQQSRDMTSRATQSERLAIAGLQREATQIRATAEVRRASISAFGQITLQVMRSVERAITGTFRTASSIVRSFVSTASAALRGLGRAVQSTFQAMSRTSAATFRGMGRLFSTFGRGITSALSGVSRAFQAAFRRDEQALHASLSRREAAMRGSQQRSASLLSGGTLGLLAGGAGIGSLLTSGFERFGQQEQLQLTFEALLRDGPKATAILGDISDFARTTAFDFVEVASSVAQFTATLGDVDQAFDMTKFLADVTALTGGTTESLGRVRLAMTQIASAGRLDAANLKQLTESLPGVPFAQILADRFFAGDVAAFSQARDAGELGATITAEAFFDAFQDGVAERFPEVEGFAQTAATTVSGLAQNLKENFSIFGATLIGIAEGPIKTFIGTLNDAMQLAGGFISGEMFRTGGATAGPANPFTALAEFNPAAQIPFEELPQELQDILHEQNGWGPNEGFVLAAAHAEDLWEKLHPPSTLDAALSDNLEMLKQLREVIFSFGAGAAIITGLAGAFQLLGFAFNFVFNPATLGPRMAAFRSLLLLGTVGGLIGVAFKQIYDASQPLRESLSRLRDTVGPLFDALKRLGGSVIDGLFRLFGSPSAQRGLEKVGDFFSGLVDSLTSGVTHLTSWIDWAATMIDLGHADAALASVGRFFLGINDSIANFLGGLIGISPEDIEAEGGGIAGLLRNTFLEPVVDFFTVTLPEQAGVVAGAVADFFSGVWNAITGGSGGGSSQDGHAVFSGPGRVTSGGSGLSAFLDTTFLAPIVTFFTETLPGAIGTIGAGIAQFWNYVFAALFAPEVGAGGGTGAVGITGPPAGGGGGFLRPIIDAFLNLPTVIRNSGWEKGLAGIWDGLAASAARIWDGDDGSGGIKAQLEKIPGLIGSFFSGLNWADYLVIGAGTLAGMIIGGAPGAVIGGAGIAAAVKAGLLDPLTDAINDGFSEGVVPALNNLWTSISNWIKEKFQVDNLVEGGVNFGLFVNDIGRMIGEFFGSPAFQAAVAGGLVFGAAVTAILASFADGLAVGLSGAFLDWAALFAEFIESAWDNIDNYLVFVPDPILNALNLVFGSAVSGAVTLLAAAIIGPAIVKGIIAGIAGFGPALMQGAGGLGALIFGGKSAAAVSADIGKNPVFKSAGAGIAASVIAGILSFEFGRAAGARGGAGNLVLSLLTGTFTGAAIGLAAGGPLTAAVTGTLSGLFAGLGYLLGRQGDEAAQARAEIERYGDAIAGLEGDARGAAGAKVVIEEILEAGQGGQRFLEEAGFNARTFFDAVISDGNVVEETLSGLFRGLAENQDQTLIPQEWNDELLDLADAIDQIDPAETPVKNLGDLKDALEDLKDAGVIDEDQFQSSIDLIDMMSDAGIGLDETIKLLDQEQVEIITANQAASQRGHLLDIAAAVETVQDAVSGIGDVLGDEDILSDQISQLREFLSGTDLTTDQKIEAVEEAARNAEDALSGARDALVDFLLGQVGTTTEVEVDAHAVIEQEDFRESIRRQADQAVAEQDPISYDYQVALNVTTVEDFSEGVAQLVRDGLDSGRLQTETQVDDFITEVFNQAMQAPGLTEEGRQALQTALDEMTGADLSSFINNIDLQETDITALETIGGELQAPLLEGLGDAGTVPQGLMSPVVTAAVSPEQYKPIVEAAGKSTRDAYVKSLTTGLSAAELTASVISGTGGTSQTTSDGAGAGIGEGFVATIVGEIEGAIGDVTAAGQKVGAGFARGVGSTIKIAAVVARVGAAAVAANARAAIIPMLVAGVNAGSAFARGVRSQVQAAANAARAIAEAAANAARAALQISSPSKVFIDIGRNVGRGFIQGIKDAEGEMSDALSQGIQRAIETAVSRARAAVSRAEAGSTIFGLLQPSNLPGGTTNTAARLAGLDITQSIGNFGSELRDAAADLFGSQSAFSELQEALRGLRAAPLAFRESFASLNEEFREATRIQREINEFDRIARKKKAGGTLTDKEKDILEGGRPELSFQQRNLLRSGPLSLNVANFAGQQNVEAFTTVLDSLREFGQSAIAAGQPIASVIAQMQTYRDNLIRQGVAMGLNRQQLLNLVEAEGLSDAALRSLRETLTSLDANTVAGAENMQMFLQSAQGIRDFGEEMLAAGFSADAVKKRLQALRDQLVNQAVAFGFNRATLNKLIAELGLSDTALNDFIKQLQAFEAEAKNAEAAAKAAAAAAKAKEEEEKQRQAREDAERDTPVGPEGIPRARINELHVHVPTGDPEAVALVVGNRLAYERVANW